MYGLLMTLFVIISMLLGLCILIQQGKGDMGVGGLGGGAQMLFGGSGGQNFIEKTTWVLGALFILGAMGLSVIKSREITTSQLSGYKKNIASTVQASEQGQQVDDAAESVKENTSEE